MCDNCKTGLRVEQVDKCEEALNVIGFLEEAQVYRNSFTVKQTIDFFRGNKIQSKFPIDKRLLNKY